MIEPSTAHLNRYVAFALALGLAPLHAQTTTRLSVDAAGIQGNGNSFGASPSADGRYVAFYSLSSNLVAGDANGKRDIYVRDQATGSIERLSLSITGGDSDGESRWPRMSSDGRFVTYQSDATNLVANDHNGVSDVFVHDRLLHTTTRVSVGLGGVEANDSSPGVPGQWPFDIDISGDGRFVAFDSRATNLVVGDTNGKDDVFVRDRLSGVTERVSVDSSGQQLNEHADYARISDDGARIAFFTGIAIDPNDLDGFDTYVRDRVAGTTTDVSLLGSGGPQPGLAGPLDISGDGRFVLLTRAPSPGAFTQSEAYVHDLTLGTTTLISVNTSGNPANGYSALEGGALSFDGRWAAFDSNASDLVANDTNGHKDVFVRDLWNGTTEIVSVSSAGNQALGDSRPWSMSADGGSIYFDAHPTASQLVAADTNGAWDVLVRNRSSSCAPVTSYCTAKTNSLGCTPAIGASGEPRMSGYDAFFITATGVFNQKSGLFFWGTNAGAIPFGGGTRCVLSPLARTTTQFSGGSSSGNDCSGTYSFHFSQTYMSSHVVAAGTPLYGQYWSRDPGFAPPNNVGLTDGLAFTPCP